MTEWDTLMWDPPWNKLVNGLFQVNKDIFT